MNSRSDGIYPLWFDPHRRVMPPAEWLRAVLEPPLNGFEEYVIGKYASGPTRARRPAGSVSFFCWTCGGQVQPDPYDLCRHPYGFPLPWPVNANSAPRCPVCGVRP